MKVVRHGHKVRSCTNNYKPMPYRAHVLSSQAREFESKQAAPPRRPTPAERELVRMYRDTVK